MSPRGLALALGCALALAPAVGQACAACACGDPTLTTLGTGRAFAGRLRLGLMAHHRSETEGAATTTEDQLALAVAYSPAGWLQLAATVPTVRRTYTADTLATDRVTHLGDVQLEGRLFLWQDRPGVPRLLVGAQLGLRLPTAPEVTASGAPLPLDAQPGLGAWSPSVGLWAGAYRLPWMLFVSARYVHTGTGYGDFNPGDSGLATALAQYQIGAVEGLALRLSADARYTGADRLQGERDGDRAGWVLLVGPGLAWAPRTDWLLSATARLPAHDGRAAGAEGPMVELGITCDL